DVGLYFDPDPPLAWPVEFAEIDRLPRAELKAPAMYEDGGGTAHHAGLYVGGGVALGVGVASLPRHGALQDEFHVGDHIGVGVFVDRDARRGVGHENCRLAFLDAGGLDAFLD